jgi:hypothetical protein
MGFVKFGGTVVYGIAAAKLATLGAILGWPLLRAMVVVAGNLWRAATGEWAGASRRSYAHSWAGISALVLAISVIARGGGAQSPASNNKFIVLAGCNSMRPGAFFL